MHNDVHSPFFQLILNDWCVLVFLHFTLLLITSRTVHPYALAQLDCQWEESKGSGSIPPPGGFGAWTWVELELLLRFSFSFLVAIRGHPNW